MCFKKVTLLQIGALSPVERFVLMRFWVRVDLRWLHTVALILLCVRFPTHPGEPFTQASVYSPKRDAGRPRRVCAVNGTARKRGLL